jgi:hypothetical protein
MDQDEEDTREHLRIMGELWARRSHCQDLRDPVLVVFESEDELGRELAELVTYKGDDGMVIALVSAEGIACALEKWVPDVSRTIRAADRSRPLAVIASLRYWFLVVSLDDVVSAE